MKRFCNLWSLAAAVVLISSTYAMANCTQGFWENHPEFWCVESLTVGDNVYSEAELLLIFEQPVEGNGLVSLAHQLIAAKLNTACGTPVVPEIAEADALIGALVVPPIGAGYLDPAVTSVLTDELDAFNNLPGDGEGFGGCSPISVAPLTWGRVKAGYR